MKIKCFLSPFYFTLCFFLLATTGLEAQNIRLHPENSRYFFYQNKPTILITSAEHYGAVINTKFDFITYLNELESKGLNLTRTFTGSYLEPPQSFNIAENTLAPGPGKFICPWPRSTVEGYANGGNKFDLSKFDPAYFKRLKDFIGAAEAKNIIVELALFCPFYAEEQWNLSPMNPKNNINNIDSIKRTDVYTMGDSKGLLNVQENLVREIVTELKDFTNVMYEICNEPYFGGVTLEWQHHIADVITETEKDFSGKHLITQNIANASAKIENPIPSVSVFNFHYAWPPVAVAINYHLNKAIGDNETGFRGNSDSTYRIEGWSFMLAGGSLYNNLDYSFTAGHERGTFHYPPTQPGGGSDSLRQQLSYLKKFVESFDFIKMHPDESVIDSTHVLPAKAHVLSETGKQYAAYFYGHLPKTFELNLPSGSYQMQWLDTKTGKYTNQKVIHSNGKIKISPPPYKVDVALKILEKT